MARSTPTVRDGTLTQADTDRAERIPVGSPAWYDWLMSVRLFAFDGRHGTFTARREPGRRGGAYWRAYRTREGRQCRAYLGRSEDLSLERLEAAAKQLANPSAVPASPTRRTDPEPPSRVAPGAELREGGRALKVPTTHHRTRVAQERWSLDFLVPTKVMPPHAHAHLVHRERLLDQLDRASAKSLTLITAPAGYGKTTLLTDWIDQRGRDVAWVSLDSADNDSVRFWTYVFTALSRIHPEASERAMAILHVPHVPPMPAILSAFVGHVMTMTEPVVLILDDYHVITADDIHDSLAFLVERLPPQLHVMLASRADPPFAISRLRVQDRIGELRVSDLRFNPDEIAAFLLKTHSMRLSAYQLAQLDLRAEGWIAGVHLAALSLHGHPDVTRFLSSFDAGSERNLVDYLVEEVMQRQPPDVQTFLMRSAILEQLCAPLCDDVLGYSAGTSQALLERLDRAHLFVVPLDPEHQWFRYHHLFADVLRARLRRMDAGSGVDLHLRASLWYEGAGNIPYAVSHAVAAQAWTRVALLVEGSAETLLERGQTTTLLTWLDRVPKAVLHAHPRLCLAHARALTTAGRLEEALDALDRAEGMRDPDDDSAERDAAPLDDARQAQTRDRALAEGELIGEVASVRGEIAYHRGQFAQAIRLYERALTLLPSRRGYLRTMIASNLGTVYVTAGDTDAGGRALALARGIAETTNNPLAMIGSQCGLGYLELLRGRLVAAGQAFQDALTVITTRDVALSPMTCMAQVGMGRVRYEWNDVDAAAEHFTAALTLSQQWGNTLYLVRSHALLARAQIARGEVAVALALLDDLEDLRQRAYLPSSVAALAAAMGVRLRLALGQVEQAEHWMRSCGLSSTDELSYPPEYGHMTLARVLLALGRTEEAQRLSERLRAAAEASGRGETAIEAQLLLARAFHALGDVANALNALQGALAKAEREGYVRLFADEGAPIQSLLTRMGERSLARGGGHSDRSVSPAISYVERIRQALWATPAPHLSGAGEPSPREAVGLHARELEIVRQLASGRSNQQIADELVVAVSTVKWHLANIYGKLGVSSRTQAIVRARALGLVG